MEYYSWHICVLIVIHFQSCLKEEGNEEVVEDLDHGVSDIEVSKGGELDHEVRLFSLTGDVNCCLGSFLLCVLGNHFMCRVFITNLFFYFK